MIKQHLKHTILIGFVMISMGAKKEKFVRDLKKLRHSYMKQALKSTQYLSEGFSKFQT